MSTSQNYKNNINRVRELLQTNSDGMTLVELIETTGLTYSCAYKAVERIRGAYVDRWTADTRTFKWAPVYCIEVPPPTDAPKPEIKVSDYLRAQEGKSA